MKDDVAIKVHDLHKSFDLAENKSTSIKQALVNLGRKNKKHRQKVLDGIDFEIKKGEFFGIVGRNGSGKSTLLKILAGVYTPDKGAVLLNGNLTPFIELGVGFNPELSGRDNVYLSASLLGYTRRTVDAMYDDIVEFAELNEHMDKKLKNYSSGMQVRLAFSIAIKAKNDILIFDEVLAVGDEAFQQKCLRIFEEYRQDGQTVVLVTHDMHTVRNLCTRAMLIDDGAIKHIGSVDDVAEMYSDLNIDKGAAPRLSENGANQHNKGAKISVTSYKNKKIYKPSEIMKLEIDLTNQQINKDSVLGVAILGNDGSYIFGSNSRGSKVLQKRMSHSIKLDIGPGRYSLNVAMLDQGGKMLSLTENALSFRVIDDGRTDTGGAVRLDFTYSGTKS